MPEFIVGPNGELLRITRDGEALTRTVQADEAHHQNEHEGEMWTFPIDALDPDATDKKFAYIQNGDSDKNIHIRRLRFTSTVAGTLEILRVTGVAAGGSAVVLVNSNENFASKTPEGIFETAADITALTDGGKHYFMNLLANVEVQELTIPWDIVLGKNGAIALNWPPSSGVLTGTIHFFTAAPVTT